LIIIIILQYTSNSETLFSFATSTKRQNMTCNGSFFTDNTTVALMRQRPKAAR